MAREVVKKKFTSFFISDIINVEPQAIETSGFKEKQEISEECQTTEYESFDDNESEATDDKSTDDNLKSDGNLLATTTTNDIKRKYPRERTTFSVAQLKFLEELFCVKKYLTLIERSKVAIHLELSERQVKTWFQNRRTKYRRQKTVNSPILSLSAENNSLLNLSDNVPPSHLVDLVLHRRDSEGMLDMETFPTQRQFRNSKLDMLPTRIITPPTTAELEREMLFKSHVSYNTKLPVCFSCHCSSPLCTFGAFHGKTEERLSRFAFYCDPINLHAK